MQEEEQQRDEMIETITAIDEGLADPAEFWDELSGQELKPDLVRKARLEELEKMRKHRVGKK